MPLRALSNPKTLPQAHPQMLFIWQTLRTARCVSAKGNLSVC